MTTEAAPVPSVNGTPPAASLRSYLRDGLPAVYRDRARARSTRSFAHRVDPAVPGEPFAMRFVGGLERVLDPIVAMLDLLPGHLDVSIAPPDWIALLGEWLGLELDAGLEPDPARLLAAHRRLVDSANEITRQRGTRAGLELLLKLAFKDLELEVRDSGGVTWSTDASRLQPAADPTLTVVCPASVDPARTAAIRRVVDDVKPAGVAFELRVEEEEEQP